MSGVRAVSDNIIQMFPDKSGYITTDTESGCVIDGVYMDELAAFKQDDTVYIGEKSKFGVDNAVMLSVKEMNQFCLMWLAIFDPEVIKYE